MAQPVAGTGSASPGRFAPEKRIIQELTSMLRVMKLKAMANELERQFTERVNGKIKIQNLAN